MYQIENIKPKELSLIQIKNQNKIVELTGSKLDPVRAYEIIKRESNGFTQDHEKAKEADKLFVDLLKLNGLWKIESEPQENELNQEREAIRIKEQERSRELELLELELQLVA